MPDSWSAESVGVVGLGYVGLPLAVAFAEAGTSVIGIDADPNKISDLEAGDSYIDDIPAEAIAALVGAGQLRPTTDYEALREADAVLICLPTPLNEHRE